jgi:coenzyme F420-reducing hydrogenase delta subunit
MEFKYDLNTLTEVNKQIHEQSKRIDMEQWSIGEEEKYLRAIGDIKQIIHTMIYTERE